MTDRSWAGSSPDSTAETEKDLVLSFQEGDLGAYREIYERHHERAEALCRRILLSNEDAAEATQETFLRVYLALPRFNGRYQLKAWIARIATNVSLDMLRARKRASATTLGPLDEESLQETDAARIPEVSYLRSSEERLVRDTLSSLPPLHRAAMVLREYEGLSYSEIAEVLGISEGRVKALLHRARGSFRRSWASTLSAIVFPWRGPRLRPSPPPEKTHTLHSSGTHLGDVAASSANFITSCSTALQQCGQFVTERAAPLFVATAVGVVGGAAAASRAPVPPEGKPHVEVRLTDDASVRLDDGRGKARAAGNTPEGVGSRAAAADPSPAAEPADPPAASPTPQPSASPSAEPVQGSKQEPKPSSNEGQPAGATVPEIAFGFTRYGPPRTSPVSQHTLSVDCTARVISQYLVSRVSDGDESYPVESRLSIDSNTKFHFSILKDGQEYDYSGWGMQPRVSWSESERVATIHVEGEYGSVSEPHPEAGGLPESGPFAIDVKVDCRTTAVVSETVTLGGI